jgi:hypothetical protein
MAYNHQEWRHILVLCAVSGNEPVVFRSTGLLRLMSLLQTVVLSPNGYSEIPDEPG